MTTNPVRDMLALFVATFGGDVDTWQRRAYERALRDVPRDVLLEAADRLINEAAAGRKFYPMPSSPEVKGACAAVVAAKRARAWQIAMAHCTHDSHYIHENGVDRRCPCWDVGMKAMAAAGHPLALPPPPSAPDQERPA